MSSRLHQLSGLGQSVWIDYLSRDLIESGALAKAVADDAVVGVTSNPRIFQEARRREARASPQRVSFARARRRTRAGRREGLPGVGRVAHRQLQEDAPGV